MASSDKATPHCCDESCTCPVHGTSLIYHPAGDEHACQDRTCIHGHGMNNWPDGQPVTPWADPWHDIGGDIRNLYLLQDSLIKMPTELPSVRRERERIYRESGEITRELIARLLAGEFDA